MAFLILFIFWIDQGLFWVLLSRVLLCQVISLALRGLGFNCWGAKAIVLGTKMLISNEYPYSESIGIVKSMFPSGGWTSDPSPSNDDLAAAVAPFLKEGSGTGGSFQLGVNRLLFLPQKKGEMIGSWETFLFLKSVCKMKS